MEYQAVNKSEYRTKKIGLVKKRRYLKAIQSEYEKKMRVSCQYTAIVGTLTKLSEMNGRYMKLTNWFEG